MTSPAVVEVLTAESAVLVKLYTVTVIEDPKFDVFLNPTKRKKQDEIVKNLTKKFQKVLMLMLMLMLMLVNIMIMIKVFKSMDLVQSYPALFQVLWHSINPCFDIRSNLFLKYKSYIS